MRIFLYLAVCLLAPGCSALELLQSKTSCKLGRLEAIRGSTGNLMDLWAQEDFPPKLRAKTALELSRREDLPADVRREWLRRAATTSYQINSTQMIYVKDAGMIPVADITFCAGIPSAQFELATALFEEEQDLESACFLVREATLARIPGARDLRQEKADLCNSL